jgi:hypothetical protein
MAISLKRRLRRRLQGSTTTCNLLARVGTASRLVSDGIGFVKVSEAQVSVKEKFFLRAKASYKVKSSDGRFARVANAEYAVLDTLVNIGWRRRQNSDWERVKTCKGCQGCFR